MTTAAVRTNRIEPVTRVWLRSPRAYLVLVVISLGFHVLTALPVERAGYMDASYTLHVGANLARGRGFVQDLVWNYLDEPTGLPHPSNLYWLPLPSILGALSFALFGVSYHAAQVPFVLLSTFLPLIAFYLARRLSDRDDYGWTAGLLTAFSGFYTVYWTSPDNFTTFAVAADLALVIGAMGILERDWRRVFIAGLCAGVAQWSRADAVLVAAALAIGLVIYRSRTAPPDKLANRLGMLVALAGGFVLVVTPWLVRNVLVVGSPLAPGTARTLWLLSYDEFFSYDVARLTFSRYLEWGAGNILGSKLTALGFNSLVVLFGVTQIFLAPFAVIGFWRQRHRLEIVAAAVYLVLLLVTMSLMFTFPAMRGSMFHSSAALVVYGAVATPFGLDAIVGWAARRRRAWNAGQAVRVFRAGAVGLALFFSVFLYSQGVFGNVLGGSDTIALWNRRDVEYAAMDRALDSLGVPDDEPVLTVDPPSFANDTGRRSISIPTESLPAVFQAANQFGSHYLVLQYDHPRPLHDLYLGRAQPPGLVPVLQTRDGLGRPATLYRLVR